MKSLVSLMMALMLSSAVYAQKDVTTFLGIPVDGTKKEMKKKLIDKGFTYKELAGHEYFEGEFNGTDVHLYIGTNNNKVYRIMLTDVANLDEANIRVRFNTLVRQFENNNRYMFCSKNYKISDSEDISYEMTTHSKIYGAVFYQKPVSAKSDTAVCSQTNEKLLKDSLDNPAKEDTIDIGKRISAAMAAYAAAEKKTVWFKIVQFDNSNRYYIAMYYDNLYNQANGEDL